MEKDFIRNRVYFIRNAHKISARSLSLELGMSTEYINQLESGRLTPSLDFLISFCDYFNISLSTFFDENIKYPVETKNIISELNKLSQEETNNVYSLLKMINKNIKTNNSNTPKSNVG